MKHSEDYKYVKSKLFKQGLINICCHKSQSYVKDVRQVSENKQKYSTDTNHGEEIFKNEIYQSKKYRTV